MRTMREAPSSNCSPPERGRGGFFCLLCLLCLIPVVTALCALVILAVKAPLLRHTSHSDASCCEEHVALLSAILNRSISPCKSAYDFACNRYSVQAAPGALLDARTIVSSWGYKPSNTRAGKLAYQYYRSCLKSSAHVERLGAQTAAALLEFLAPAVKFPLRLIVEISLKYGILLPVSFMSENMHNTWHYPLPKRTFFNVYHVAVALFTIRLPWLSKKAKEVYHQIRLDALHKINEALVLNVSEFELEIFGAAVRVTTEPAYTAANLTALNNLIPSLTVAQWQTLLENATGSEISGIVYFHSNIGALKRSLEILLDPTTEAKSAVFSLVEAASRLVIGAVQEKDKRDVRTRHFARCQQGSTSIAGPLLIVDILETFNAGKLQDVLFRTYFRSITEAVCERAATLVAPEDIDSVRAYIRRTRLLLPSEVFRLDLVLPALTDDYAHNYLLMQASHWTLYDFPMPHDVPRLQILKSTKGAKARVFNNVVILPLRAYSALNMTHHLDAVVSLGTLGMLMADAVWRSVLEFKWSKATTRRLRSYSKCIAQEKSIRHKSRFFYPTLSLDATLDAARGKNWKSTFKLYAHQLQATSRSQLFFLLILFHYYCPVAREASPVYKRREANYLFFRSDDFRQAFGCTRKPASTDVRRC